MTLTKILGCKAMVNSGVVRHAVIAFLFSCCLCSRTHAQVIANRPATEPQTSARTYSLVPRDLSPNNIEYARTAASGIVEVVQTMLYSQAGVAAAAQQGRKLWYDPSTLQLTVVDTTDNLQRVSTYLKSIETLRISAPRKRAARATLSAVGRKPSSEIIMLRHQNASDISALVDRVMR